jgi:hypothetical protein
MKINRARSGYMSSLMLLALLAGACGGQGNLSPYYKFPIIPIKIAYDVLSQSLTVSFSGEIQTPVGAFGLTTGVGFSEQKASGLRTLTIQTGGKSYVYKLERGQRYSINVPSDENGQTQVRYSGEDENLSIVIPNPTTETVAGLREQLKAAQEALEHGPAKAEGDEGGEVYDAAVNTNLAKSVDDDINTRRAQEEEAAAAEAAAAEAQRQRELQWQAREAELQRSLNDERRERAAAEDLAQQALRAEQEAKRQKQDAETQRRDDEARQHRREQERKIRRNEKLVGLGIEAAREIIRRSRN